MSEFIGIPQVITPEFAHPMRQALEGQQLSSANLYFTHGEARAFIIRDSNGKALGRATASFDQNLHQEDGQLVGHMG